MSSSGRRSSTFAAPEFVPEPLLPDSWDAVVIKVKYGDTLKRFNAFVNGSQLDQNLAQLRSNIINAFKFSPNADLMLTYTDEDGDIVMLDDDDDLRDATYHQKLNPLRINVQVRGTDGGASEKPQNPNSATQTANFTPVNLVDHVKPLIDEALKSLPEQVRDTVLKFYQDLLSNVASSAPPTFNDLLESFSKLGTASNNTQPSNGPVGGSSGSSSCASKQPVNHKVNAEPKVPANTAPRSFACEETGYASIDELLFPLGFDQNNTLYCNEPSDAHQKGKAVMSDGTPPAPATVPLMDICNYKPSKPSPTTCVFDANARGHSDYKRHYPVPPFHGRGRPNTAYPGCTKSLGCPYRNPHGNQESPLRTCHRWIQCDGCGRQPIVGPRYKSLVKDDYDLCSTCFSRMGNEADYSRIDIPTRPSRMFGDVNAVRWIQCDGCGMQPIVGPRYKSIVKDNYDLCSTCFSRMGNEADYTRIDIPNMPNGMFGDVNPCLRYPSSHAHCAKPNREKLESRFIQDVSVLDGTVMAPSTLFTKIWRMHNNGSTLWPFGTKLIWVGGDQFAIQTAVQLEVPVTGFPVDEEIDIAVDFAVPSRPGRYISYWRLSSPSGQKFGQRVWVLIQVEQPTPTDGENQSAIDLNLPLESSAPNGKGLIGIDMNAGIIDADFTPAIPELQPFLYEVPSKESQTAQSDIFAVPVVVPPLQNLIIDLPQSSSNATPAVSVPAVISINEPIIDLPPPPETIHAPIIDLPTSSSNATPVASVPVPEPETINNDNDLEEALLKELEEMGFRQVSLNKEILRQNKYNLEQSVEDLCGLNEWDPLLTELQEMGFDDAEANKEMLAKNGGSITGAVMDLVAREKDQ